MCPLKVNLLKYQGPFQFSRNPMYLGGVIVQTGLAVCSGNIISFLAPLLFFVILNFIFIPFEEEKKGKELGEEYLRVPLKIHFGGQTNLFVPGGVRQKQLYFQIKLDSPSLPENKNLLFAAQKQLLEPPLKYKSTARRWI
jgi:hypothetical protein